MTLRKSFSVFFAVLFFLLAFNSAAQAKVYFKHMDELSDSDINPQGRTAFLMERPHWYHAESEHFIYHFTSYDDSMELYVTGAEDNYRNIKKTFEINSDRWQKKAHIFVFTDKRDWDQFAGGQLGGKASAYTTGWELFILHVSDGPSQLRTLLHELTHVILFRFLDGPAPLFLNEGFAEYISINEMMAQSGRDTASVSRLTPISPDRFYSIENLAGMERYPNGREEDFYIESEALVRYLIFNFGGKQFYELVRETARGKSFRRAFEDGYRVSLTTLEQDFRDFITS